MVKQHSDEQTQRDTRLSDKNLGQRPEVGVFTAEEGIPG
jgi:hypothetical protein